MLNPAKLKSILSVGLFLMLITPILSAQYSGGTGTAQSPYEIATAQDLIDLGDNTDDYDKHFIMTADIDLAGRVFDKAVIAGDIDAAAEFQGVKFCGSFNGNYFNIVNLNILSSGHYIGLFGSVGQVGEIFNLRLSLFDISGMANVGAIAGTNSGLISRCQTRGIVTATGENAGGMCGNNTGGVISESWADCTVSGIIRVGGISGASSGTVTKSYALGNVSGDSRVGGLSGSCYYGVIDKCYASGSLVNGRAEVGGLCGYNNVGLIKECYAAVEINSTEVSVGGLCGYSSGSVYNSYWDMEVSGQSQTIGNGIGLTTEQMCQSEYYIAGAWFDDIWIIAPGDYPHLYWEQNYGEYIAIKTLSGDGSEEYPWQINTLADLISAGRSSGIAGDHFILNSDIDCTGYLFDTAIFSAGGASSGFNGVKFSGIFNGNGHEIRNLNLKGVYYCGIFGYIAAKGKVRDLSLENITVVSADDYTGGLCGYNLGGIYRCFVSGEISGEDSVGIVCGYNEGKISNCYAMGEAEGYKDIGGICGTNVISSGISNCYTVGQVSGDIYINNICAGDVGGVNCYYYEQAGLDRGSGTGLSDEELIDSSSFEGFDFVGSDIDGNQDIWAIEEGYMPRLFWQSAPGFSAPRLLDSIVTTLEGTGYPDDPFIIADQEDMEEFRSNSLLRIGCYKLISDVDASGVTYGKAFIPEAFYGTFDGNDHVISGLRLNGNASLGLFSRLIDADVYDLGLIDVEIASSGGLFVGGLCAVCNGSEISNCFVSGALTGYSCVGGLCGYLLDGYIINSYTEGTVNGIRDVGGLLGFSASRVVSGCYSSSNVTGEDNVGGLFGRSASHIVNCYSYGSVSGTIDVGGFGGSDSGTIANCYSAGSVSNNNIGGGFVGYSYKSSLSACFWDIQSSGKLIGTSFGTLTGLTGLYTAEMSNQSVYTASGWSFLGNTSGEVVWQIGANDYPTLAWEGMPDMDNSGLVDIADFAIMADKWLRSDCYKVAPDFDKSGIVNQRDLEWFAEHWLEDPARPDDLLGHWTLDRGSSHLVIDSSVYGNHGTSLGGLSYAPGKVSVCGVFDGYDDCVSVPYILSPSEGPFTACLWVRGGSSGQCIVSQTNGNGIGRIWLGVNSENKLWTALMPSGGSTLASPIEWDANQWHHLAVVWDGKRRHIYIDGTIVVEDVSDMDSLEYSNGKMYIGAHKDLYQANFWNGSIDDVRIYGNALSNNDIEALVSYEYDSLIGHWALDESNSFFAIDSSVYENDGFIYGSPVFGTGIDGGCYVFDGNDDYVSIPYITSPSYGPFTACLWAWGGKPGQNMLCQTNGIGTGRIWLGLDYDNKLRTALMDDGGSTLVSPELWDAGKWHHVAFVWDGSKRHVYVDGVVVVEDLSDINSLEFSNGKLLISAHKDFHTENFWQGAIDDVRVYARALTVSELQGLADLEFDYLIADWGLNEISGVIAADDSAYGNPGTVYGTPLYSAGVEGGCYVFDGDDYIVSEGCPGVAGALPRSVSAWIKADADFNNTDNDLHCIVSWGRSISGSNYKWFVSLDDNTGQLALGTYGARLKGGPDLEDGQWHHIAVVLPVGANNINQVKMYVDGMEIATNAESLDAIINTTLSAVSIGAVNASIEQGIYTPSQLFRGCIDGVKVYSRGLSIEEIAGLADVDYYEQEEIIGHWPFDALEGVSVKDISVYNNSGLAIGKVFIKELSGGGCLYLIDNGYVSLPGIISPTDGAFTVCVWALGGQAGQSLICQADGSGFGRIWLGLSTDNKMRTGLSGTSLDTNTIWDSTKWQHVAFVWDGVSRHIYVNGVLAVVDSSPVVSMEYANGPIYVGAHKYLDDAHFWDGFVDDVLIYKRALSAQEIAQLAGGW